MYSPGCRVAESDRGLGFFLFFVGVGGGVGFGLGFRDSGPSFEAEGSGFRVLLEFLANSEINHQELLFPRVERNCCGTVSISDGHYGVESFCRRPAKHEGSTFRALP